MWSVDALRTMLYAPQITAFVTLYNTMMVTLGSIVLGYVGVTGVIQWKHGTQDDTKLISDTEEKITRTFAPKHFDDDTIQ